MHAQELIELAAIIASNGGLLIRQPGPLDAPGLERYWTACKCRLDRWNRSLRQWDCATRQGTAPGADAAWPAIQGVLEEILTGEILTRVWSAVASTHDRLQRTSEAEPIVRSVYLGHQEARNRALTLLVQGPGIQVQQALKLDQLRRRADRWCDMLVGYLANSYDVSEFAVDPARARDFSEDFHEQAGFPGGRQVWPLVQAALRGAFRGDLAAISPNADLNARIASGILACIPPEAFDSTGLLRSLWSMRLAEAASDVQGLIETLLGPDCPSAGQRGSRKDPGPPAPRSRRFGNSS
jgi:hypothetical protein